MEELEHQVASLNAENQKLQRSADLVQVIQENFTYENSKKCKFFFTF